MILSHPRIIDFEYSTFYSVHNTISTNVTVSHLKQYWLGYLIIADSCNVKKDVRRIVNFTSIKVITAFKNFYLDQAHMKIKTSNLGNIKKNSPKVFDTLIEKSH